MLLLYNVGIPTGYSREYVSLVEEVEHRHIWTAEYLLSKFLVLVADTSYETTIVLSVCHSESGSPLP
jgi:hypothetical protein